MTECRAPLIPEVHPALRARFSPVMFREDVNATVEQIDALLDAARLTPSAGNSQPWRFIVGRRGDPVHARVVRHLARSSSVWVPSASLLVVNLAHVAVEGTSDWEYSEFSRYDLGQAVAHMTVQGLAMGMNAHQFRAFNREAVMQEFAIPSHFEVTSMTAIGLAAHEPGAVLAAGTSRERATRAELTWARESGFPTPGTP